MDVMLPSFVLYPIVFGLKILLSYGTIFKYTDVWLEVCNKVVPVSRRKLQNRK